jgi:hypothetical protein
MTLGRLKRSRRVGTCIVIASVAYVITLIALRPSVAAGSSDTFVEISRGTQTETWTYDLRSVQLIEPEKFTVNVTVVADPDVMRFNLKSLDTLWTYCEHPDGQYPAPPDLLTLGKPDMPVEKIKVETSHGLMESKVISWRVPYNRLPWRDLRSYAMVFCWGGTPANGTEWYRQARSVIVNGYRARYFYDCKRAVMGHFFEEKEDVSETFVVHRDTGFARDYQALCQRVTGKAPYPPD